MLGKLCIWIDVMALPPKPAFSPAHLFVYFFVFSFLIQLPFNLISFLQGNKFQSLPDLFMFIKTAKSQQIFKILKILRILQENGEFVRV